MKHTQGLHPDDLVQSTSPGYADYYYSHTISPEQSERMFNLRVEKRMPPGWWLIPALILGPVVMVALAYAGGAF